MKKHIKVKVRIERVVKGQTEPYFTDNFMVEADVEDRRATYYTLMREFGRCYGCIPMGYKFGKKIKFDNGTEGFEYAEVIIIEGAKPAPGFVLVD